MAKRFVNATQHAGNSPRDNDMDIQDVIIRPMEKDEGKTVEKIDKRAFPLFEGLFIVTPRRAMVAEYKGNIIGAIVYKYEDTKTQQIIYIDAAFVDSAYRGMGVGKKLYTETFYYLQEWGCDVMTALVKDDNAASWEIFIENGFHRASLLESAKYIGLSGMLKQYFTTELCFSVGMDLYIYDPERPVPSKKDGKLQWLLFLLGNLLLALPLWIRILLKDSALLLPNITAYLTLLVLMLLTRYFGARVSGLDYHLRLNNGGGLLTMCLSFFGILFPMNANWYPVIYRNTAVFHKMLAMPEMVKWLIFLLLPLFCFSQDLYLNALGKQAGMLLLFSLIPIYPFECYGAGRIYQYKKGLWILTTVISIALVLVLFIFLPK